MSDEKKDSSVKDSGRLSGPDRAIVPVLVERELYEHSDGDHAMSVTQLRENLEKKYNIHCAPKSNLIKNALLGLEQEYPRPKDEALEQKPFRIADLEIDRGEAKNSKWKVRLESRTFERDEVAHLISLCYSSHVGEHGKLVGKLKSLLSEHEREGITDPYEKPAAGAGKSLAETLYEVGILQEAINYNDQLIRESKESKEDPGKRAHEPENGLTVSFVYRNQGSEAVEYPGLFPLQVQVVDGYYYLVCARPKKNSRNAMRPGVSFFRVEWIERLEKTPCFGLLPPGYGERRELAAVLLSAGVDRIFPDSEKKLSRVIIKIKGEEKRVKRAERYVRGRFSHIEDFTELNPDADGFPKYRFTVGREGFKLWVLKWLDCIEVVHPKSLRGEIVELVKNNVYGEFEEKRTADE